VWPIRLMKTAMPAKPYKKHRFPAEIISHAVWLYCRFCLSYRDVEELLLAHGVTVTYAAMRKWCRQFGQAYTHELRPRQPRPGDQWHLDEVCLNIHGERHYLWWAVDQDGNILDILVQRWRGKKAAKTFFRKLLKGLTDVPRVIITDRRRSYSRDSARCGTPPAPGSEQPRREFPSADPPARAADAGV
jgi:putative transposase